jgi:TonB-linked SusC/RagA family outer membrane protein
MMNNKNVLWLIGILLLFSYSSYAQKPVTITGTVTGNTSETLPGVGVKLKGSNIASTTDINGKYAIQVPDGKGILIFSYIGYDTKEVNVNGKTQLNVDLLANVNALDELVVIGYGVQSRTTLTTSISKVSAEEFKNAPGTNPLMQLQGKVAGLSLQMSNGQPGATPQIFIRGGSSTSPETDAPLIIVDGIVGAVRNIVDLNPDDIESMQVLKDAASTAIYGARAANGIIIVKTKSGKSGATQINFKVSSGVDVQANKYDFASAEEYIYTSRKNIMNYNKTNPDFFLTGGRYGMSTGNPRNSKNTLEFLDTYIQNYGQEYVSSLITNEGWQTMTDPVTNKKLIFKETNYQDVFFQNALKMQYDFNMSGGNDKATYYFGAGYSDQKGIVLGTGYKNYNALFNGTYKMSEKWSLNANVAYSISDNDSPTSYFNSLSRSVLMPFTYRLNYESGLPAPGEGIASFRNRNHEVYYKEKNNDIKVHRVTLGLGAKWDILPGLSFAPAAYLNTSEGMENRFEAFNEIVGTRPVSANHNFFKKVQLDGVLTYDKNLTSDHHINAILGTSYTNDYTYNMTGSGNSAPTDYIPTLNATGITTQRVSTTKDTNIWGSYFSRFTYDFRKKYLFSASLRYDGSSRFAKSHKWGLFPGVSAGWNMHMEDFWQPLQAYLSSFKLRSSWGKTGNDNLTIGDSQGAYATGFSYMGQVGIMNTVLANGNLKWETTTSFDVGADIGLFNNKLTLVLDYYNKLTDDRLFAKPLTSTTGFTSITSNYGSIRNEGFELELGFNPIKNSNFSWNTAFNFSYNRGLAVKLPENGEYKNRSGGNYVYDPASNTYMKVGGLAEGEPYGQRWAYKSLGVYATDADAANAPYDVETAGRQKFGGDAIWADLDNNGRIDNNDMVFMGLIRPDKTGGMVNTFNYKGLSMRLVLDYGIGHVIDNNFRAKTNGSARNNNMMLKDALGSNVWKEQGDIATIPRYTVQSDVDYNFRNHLRFSNAIGNDSDGSNNSLYYSKGDYLAFREVSFAYLLKPKFLGKTFIKGIELTAGIYNLGYLTKYDGLSPEIFTGRDEGKYPRPRQYSFSLNLSL